MTDFDVMKDFNHCRREECGSCSRAGNKECKYNLMRDVAKVMGYLQEALKAEAKANKEAQEKARAALAVANWDFTKEQLVEKVNKILDSFTDYNEENTTLESKIIAVGDFMRMANLRGHIAVNMRAESIQIRLDK